MATTKRRPLSDQDLARQALQFTLLKNIADFERLTGTPVYRVDLARTNHDDGGDFQSIHWSRNADLPPLECVRVELGTGSIVSPNPAPTEEELEVTLNAKIATIKELGAVAEAIGLGSKQPAGDEAEMGVAAAVVSTE